MDYTTITREQEKYIKKLRSFLLNSNDCPIIVTTYPDGTKSKTYLTDDINVFWTNLYETHTEEWVMIFNQILDRFKMAIPWYEKRNENHNVCPFCRIDGDMIDFCLSQRKVQIKDKWKSLVWSTLWSSIGGVIASLLFKTFS